MASAADPPGETSSGAIESGKRDIDRDIWAMAWPAMLSLLIVNLVDIVDVALVGRLGRQTVAAWGYATQCVNLVETLVQSVGIACVALVARAIGARDPARGRRALAASMFVSETVAAIGLMLALCVPGAIFRALDAGPDVVAIATPFFRLEAGAMLLYGAAFMFESGLRANKNTRGPMGVAFSVMAIKTILSLLLIFGALGCPRLGLTGAGIATLAAHGVGLVLYVVLSRRAARRGMPAASFGLADLRAFWDVAADVAKVSLPTMGERLIMNLALLAYFKLLSTFGTAAVAAYAIGVRLLSISWVPGLGFGAAASTFVGQALGAGDSVRARQIGRCALRQALVVMGLLGVLFAFLRGPLADAFTQDERIAEDLTPFMLMLAIAQPFMGAHFTLAGVLRGAGDTVTPLVGAALGNWGFRVPLAWLAARVLGAPLMWVWAALIADHISRMLINGGVFLFGKWDRRTGASVGSVRLPH
ncbi:MAG TPA: MATE family efflux transporter [Polyangiaceae bacterium]|jgi:putative MATE family efflux protein|nr:MATE family efflux transporter [Polyangiaceae bacterium]